MHTCLHAFENTHTHMHTYIFIFISTYRETHTEARTHTFMYTCAHTQRERERDTQRHAYTNKGTENEQEITYFVDPIQQGIVTQVEVAVGDDVVHWSTLPDVSQYRNGIPRYADSADKSFLLQLT